MNAEQLFRRYGAGSLGQQVRTARGGTSQRELARRVGITPSYLSDIENDRRRPSEAIWKALTLAIPVYGGALVDELVRELERNEPNVYAAVLLRGMAKGRQICEAEHVPDTLSEKPGLDVERLARAVATVHAALVVADHHRAHAQRIAAEYEKPGSTVGFALGSTDSEGRYTDHPNDEFPFVAGVSTEQRESPE